jgi:hypothetical protein
MKISPRREALFCRFHALLNSELMQDIQREFTHHVVCTPDACLRQDTIGTPLPYIMSLWQPGTVEHTGAKRPGICRGLWT